MKNFAIVGATRYMAPSHIKAIENDFPIEENLSHKVFSLSIHGYLSEKHQSDICIQLVG